jgi:hypothetical protein
MRLFGNTKIGVSAQIINLANICIINNLRNPAPGRSCRFCNFLLGSPKVAEAENGGSPVGPLPSAEV